MRDVTRVIRTATDDEENERVQGTAHVTVTSRANGKSVSGDTNDDGIVNLDIKALAEDPDHVGTDKLKEWNFNATIQVSCDGYRTFETALVRVSGGFGLIVPMHPTDFDGPYPHRVSFDEWDALYTKNEFLLAAGNTGDHTIQVVMHNVTSTDLAIIQLWVDGEGIPRQIARVAPDRAGKVVTAALKGPFLKKGDSQALPVGASFHISMTQGAATYSWPVSFALFDGVFDAPSSKEKVTLKPFDTSGSSGTKFDIKWPSSVPLVGNGSLNFWTPSLPIDIYVNPFGYIQLTLKTPQWGYKNDNGDNAGGKWGEFPRKSVSAQWNKMLKTAQSMADKTNALVSKPGGFQQIDFTRSFSFLVNFQAVACARWDTDMVITRQSGHCSVAVDTVP